MENAKKIKIEDYSYNLPYDKIAKYPLAERDNSKLLVYKNSTITDTNFENIQDFLPPHSLLVFNNTKVIQARIKMLKKTGAKIEIFCLEPHFPSDYEQNFASNTTCSWHCMVGNLKKWKNESLSISFQIGSNTIELTATKIDNLKDNPIINFRWNDSNICFADILNEVGSIPIPPYLNRESEQTDTERYQTVYSKIKGSVAAPTAGLHFTDNLLRKLINNGIKTEEVTLHVGAGTFKPVKAEYISQHEMHVEAIVVSKSKIENILNNIPNIIAVGTTSVRTLETLYWLGVKAYHSRIKDNDEFEIMQWEAYQLPQNVSAYDSFQALLSYMDKKKIETIFGKTQIMIVPGYCPRIVKGLITNFHQPQSTLLLLIASFVGCDWKNIYNYALNNNYRFLSYGDSSLIFY
jgi:S-adenosylmethionine:tRNA ribosyltransferase-isomerase